MSHNGKHRQERSGPEQRQHFRINAELRISVAPVEGKEQPEVWAYSEEGAVSPLVAPKRFQLRKARTRIQEEQQRPVNISAGGMRAGFGPEAGDRKTPQVEAGDQVGVLLELKTEEDEKGTLVHVPGVVVWVENTPRWVYMAFKFGEMPDGIERVLSQFVTETERRRLRSS